jgi:16S rRNA (cytidine1402-2'-O)-methyltransferase
MKTGRLYLIPVPLGQAPVTDVLPEPVRACAATRAFRCRKRKTARAFLKSLPADTPLQQIEILELNEHTQPARYPGCSPRLSRATTLD